MLLLGWWPVSRVAAQSGLADEDRQTPESVDETRLRLDEIIVSATRTPRTRFDVPRTHRTVFAESFRGTTIGSDFRRDLEQQRDLVYGKFIAEDLGGPVETLAVSISWQVQQEDRDRIRGNGVRDRSRH